MDSQEAAAKPDTEVLRAEGVNYYWSPQPIAVHSLVARNREMVRGGIAAPLPCVSLYRG